MATGGARVQDLLDAVIETGQASRRTVEAPEIERFIASRPDVTGPVTVRNLRGNAKVGASSGIVIFTADYDEGKGRQTRDLVLRHAPGSDTRLWYDYDLKRQFRVQCALQGSGVPVPNGLWLDAAGDHLGMPGFIMEMNPGVAPNPSAFAIGPMAEASTEDREAMIDQVLSALVKIHAVDLSDANLSDFSMSSQGDTPMQRCINWYWETWEWISQPDYARLAPVRKWLLDHAPATGETLTHGDSTLHNYMFVGSRLTSVLDWEMSCIARPENDLALQTIGNELFAAPVESGLPQPPSQDAWIERYVRLGGREPADLSYYRRLTGFMILIAIVSLQRNMPVDVREAQRGFIDRLWSIVEA